MSSDFASAVDCLYSQQSSDKESIRAAVARRTNTVQDMREYMRRIGISYKNYPMQQQEGVSGRQEENNVLTDKGGGKVVRTYSAFESIIHITGTKGKGSTCSMCESILRRTHGAHTGLFTSPHLVNVAERIRLDGKPVSSQEFADAYFEVRNRLLRYVNDKSQASTDSMANSYSNDVGKDNGLPVLPGYFRMLTLVALFIFAHHKFNDGSGVDVIILEVGMGGRHDATNAFEQSVVCGVTVIDYDHTRVLGNTLGLIALEKGGIIKRPAIFPHRHNGMDVSYNNPLRGEFSDGIVPDVVTTEQNDEEVIDVLKRCAGEALATIKVVGCAQRVQPNWKIGLAGDHQRMNAEVAVAICEAWQAKIAFERSLKCSGLCSVQESLLKASWPGRCQTIVPAAYRGRLRLHCDGAHTEKSIASCVSWYRRVIGFDEVVNVGDPGAQKVQNEVLGRRRRRVLLFNCSHERNPVFLLQQLVQLMKEGCGLLFHEVHFCYANSERYSTVAKSSAKELLEEAGMFNGQEIQKSKKSDEYYKESQTSGLEGSQNWQGTLALIWTHLENRTVFSQGASRNEIMSATVHSGESVKDAVTSIGESVKAGGDDVDVLITGSLYIVGSALEASGWTEEFATGSLALQDRQAAS